MTTQQEAIDLFKRNFPYGSSILPVFYWQHPDYPEKQSYAFYALHPGDHPKEITYSTGILSRILRRSMDDDHDGAMPLLPGETPISIISTLGMICYQDETAYLDLFPIPHSVDEVEAELELRQKLQLLTSPTETAILTKKTWKGDSRMSTAISTLALTQRGGRFELHDIGILAAYALDKAYSFSHKGIVVNGTGFNHMLELTKEIAHFVWESDYAFNSIPL